MFERFTDRARRVVVLAQEEARLLGHDYIGTEHILLGLIHEGEGVAAKTLERLGIALEAVRAKVELIVGEGSGAPSGHIPFTPRSKKVLELSLREALQLGHNYIGTEHILLGLIREGEGLGAQVLTDLGAELSTVRQEVVQQLSGYRNLVPGMRRFAGPGQRLRETPAAARASAEARRLARGTAVGSQHYLLGLLGDPDSLATKALADLGVTREAVEIALSGRAPAGTSDETPEEAGARRIGLRVEGQSVMLEIDDADLARALEQAMAGRTARVITGTDPEADAAGFPALWSAVARTIEDLGRRLTTVAGTVRMTGRVPGSWRPPGWREGGHAGTYWITSGAEGHPPAGHFQRSNVDDPDTVRSWLRRWFAEHGASLVEGAQARGAACCSLWAYVDRAGDGFTMTSFGFGVDGPAGAVPVPLEMLLADAAADLARPA